MILSAIRNYAGRETAKPPKWLGTLLTVDWQRALRTGLLVILALPSDILVMLTVGVNLAQARQHRRLRAVHRAARGVSLFTSGGDAGGDGRPR